MLLAFSFMVLFGAQVIAPKAVSSQQLNINLAGLFGTWQAGPGS